MNSEIKEKSFRYPLRVGGARISHFENLHILLWLLKDTSWLIEWRIFGTIMIIPTIAVAIAITVMNWRNRDDKFWINLAICFWLSANSFWMCCEFFVYEEYKMYAGFPFALGFVCVGWFYGKRFFIKDATKLEDYL